MISKNIRKHQKIIVILLDQINIYISFIIAFLLRFDFNLSQIPKVYINNLIFLAPIISTSTLVILMLFGLYHIVWRFIGIIDFFRLTFATLIVSIFAYVVGVFVDKGLPISITVISWNVFLSLASIVRLMPRFFVYIGILDPNASIEENNVELSSSYKKRTLIVGGGNATELLLKDIIENKYIDVKIVGIVDDNKLLHKRRILGVPVIGSTNEIVRIANLHSVEQIIFSIPSATEDERKRILEICNQTPCKLKIITGYIQMLSDTQKVIEVRDVTIEDLLGRKPIETNISEVGRYLAGMIVLVTGGGGSIGSELARQIVRMGPKELIIVDIYENNAYQIQQELLRVFPNLELTVLIASVRDKKRMEAIFEKYRPNVVFHAAAHKHVPLMEDSPTEAIKNNIYGTYITATLADKYKTDKFILISTDKAVNPTNIMGATKRVCEMLVQTIGKESSTSFVAVRFGNVLGSNGSVIPLFKDQIRLGGPVTVTHPDIVRYFMTIPEAVALVLQAGAYAEKGEIFVLDMGEPVKILDLAERMVRLSGFKPYEDIKIVFSGLRPGEKLYEELLIEEEGLRTTPNHKIFIVQPLDMKMEYIVPIIEHLNHYAKNNESDKMIELLNQIVPITNGEI